MPEYLAPGVYVEETSFRAKSIEGVSTSTTAFVGPTRKGPVGGLPEIITSFNDFERIYGGFEDLGIPSRVNYSALAVQAYFANGGSRLYFSRVFQELTEGDAGVAQSTRAIVDNGTAAEDQAHFSARFPGAVGNGQISVTQVATEATAARLRTAVEGSLLRTGGESPATHAQLTGGTAPFRVPAGSSLLLTVDGTDQSITFEGAPAQVTSSAPLAASLTLDDTTRFLTVTIDGLQQVVTLADAPGSISREQALSAINQNLVGGFASLSATDELVIGSDISGSSSSVVVAANSELQFPAAVNSADLGLALGNVSDLSAVTTGEIDALLSASGIAVRASQDPETGNLVLTTTGDPGSTRTLADNQDGAAGTANEALGLTDGATDSGDAGSALSYYVRRGTSWEPQNVGQPPITDGDSGHILSINAVARDGDGNEHFFEDMGFDRNHPRAIHVVLNENPTRRIDALENTFGVRIGANVNAFALRDGLFGSVNGDVFSLISGNDGGEPENTAYAAAFASLEPLDDISIIAAPGHSALTAFQAVQNTLIEEAERARTYRIAVLDTPRDQAPSQARTVRSRIDSTKAALYYPWNIVPNPLARPGREDIAKEVAVPPSGAICGIYARNDVERGVYKSPANEVVRGALRFESEINFAQQGVLNPEGINCLRFFPGRGYRVWGARLASSDPERKYVSDRRYMNYLMASIDRGTQWAAFEPNGEALWSNVRSTVASFLYNEWRSGYLLGKTEEQAFFVRCDRSTMTQNDLDNGRLICLIGVAIIKPAEFVIFRIGQKTADA